MKRAGGLYPAIAEHENLLAAYHAARSGKQDRPAVLAFTADLDHQIELLRRELLAENVQLRGYRFFTIHDPKPRRIAAPAFRDRVLHHAILRGGSWNNNSINCRSANRNRNNPENTNNNNGFRVVCAPAHTEARSAKVRTGGRSGSVPATCRRCRSKRRSRGRGW